MDIIEINGMEFYSKIGCFKEEKMTGNRFLVDVRLVTNCNIAANSDNIDDALNYQQVYDFIKDEMKKECNLLENVTKRILDTLFSNFRNLDEAEIRVSKMNPPMGGMIKRVSISMKRKNM